MLAGDPVELVVLSISFPPRYSVLVEERVLRRPRRATVDARIAASLKDLVSRHDVVRTRHRHRRRGTTIGSFLADLMVSGAPPLRAVFLIGGSERCPPPWGRQTSTGVGIPLMPAQPPSGSGSSCGWSSERAPAEGVAQGEASTEALALPLVPWPDMTCSRMPFSLRNVLNASTSAAEPPLAIRLNSGQMRSVVHSLMRLALSCSRSVGPRPMIGRSKKKLTSSKSQKGRRRRAYCSTAHRSWKCAVPSRPSAGIPQNPATRAFRFGFLLRPVAGIENSPCLRVVMPSMGPVTHGSGKVRLSPSRTWRLVRKFFCGRQMRSAAGHRTRRGFLVTFASLAFPAIAIQLGRTRGSPLAE